MNSLQRAWLGSKNHWRLQMLSVFSVSVAFVCLGAALLVVFNIHQLRRDWEERGQLSVYLVEKTPPETVAKIAQALRESPDVTSVEHVTQASARARMLAHSHDDVLAALPSEAFPESLEVRLVPDEASGSDGIRAQLVAKLQELPAVEGVQTYEVWTNRLVELLGSGLIACGFLALVVLAAVGSVVGSTIRLSLQRRRDEVDVLKLVGATDAYVSRPFLLEGAAQGGLGAMLALMLLGALFLLLAGNATRQLTSAIGMSLRFLSPLLCLFMVTVGAALGLGAALLSLKRMLRT